MAKEALGEAGEEATSQRHNTGRDFDILVQDCSVQLENKIENESDGT